MCQTFSELIHLTNLVYLVNYDQFPSQTLFFINSINYVNYFESYFRWKIISSFLIPKSVINCEFRPLCPDRPLNPVNWQMKTHLLSSYNFILKFYFNSNHFNSNHFKSNYFELNSTLSVN